VRRTPVGLRLRGASSPLVEPAPVCADTKHAAPLRAAVHRWQVGTRARSRSHLAGVATTEGCADPTTPGGRGHLTVGCRSARSCTSWGRPQTHCLLVRTRVSSVARPRCQTSACARAACRRRSGRPWHAQACRLGACGGRDRRDRFRRPGAWHGAIAMATCDAMSHVSRELPDWRSTDVVLSG